MRHVREQRHICGERYQEIDIYSISERQYRRSSREKKREASRPAQENLNDKNSIRHLTQLLNTNFCKDDMHITLTYSEDHLPESEEAAEKQWERWMRRVRDLCKKKELPPPKYISVTESSRNEDEKETVRVHHHTVISCGLDRDELESLWTDRDGSRLGWTNADRLQPAHGSLEAMAKYITKSKKHKRRWRQSRNLKQPVRPAPNDTKYTARKVERIAKERIGDREFWEKQYQGWKFGTARAAYDDFNGWHITVAMYKEERKENHVPYARR